MTGSHNMTCVGTNDAIDDSVYRLLSQLDIDSNGRLGIEFATGDLVIEFSQTGEVRSLWGPARMELITWR